MDYYQKVREAADAIETRVGRLASVGVVLGSGLGGCIEMLRDQTSIPYDSLPHWPFSHVPGHEGRVVAGTLHGRATIALAGRCHAYEGQDPATVAFGVRVLGLLGVRVLILTNAAGGINTGFVPGAVMIIDDHINLMGINPLVGPNDDRFGPRFPDMSQVYSPRLRVIAERAAQTNRLQLVHGVYAAVAGPSYETPAEIRYLRAIGADAVGMSTVPEAIAARHMGVEVLGLSCISNMAAGILPRPLDHVDVLDATKRAQADFVKLLEGIVGEL